MRVRTRCDRGITSANVFKHARQEAFKSHNKKLANDKSYKKLYRIMGGLDAQSKGMV